MSRGRLAIHAHFYQPERRDPFGGRLARDPTAAPFASWNARITAECYRPNAERGNLDRISFDVGPTLTGWLAARGSGRRSRGSWPPTAAANAVAQAFHHAILPLASARDRRTEIRWGLRDFAAPVRPAGDAFWLPETAVDRPSCATLAEEGVRATILAPWQASTPGLETRRPYRVELGGGRDLVVAFYDAGLSGAVSFQPEVTADADRFARDWVRPLASPRSTGTDPRGASRGRRSSSSPRTASSTATTSAGATSSCSGWSIRRSTAASTSSRSRTALAAEDPTSLPVARIADRTSWSCHHGVLRWSAECPCSADGRWKEPLRAALERLAGAIDAVTEAAGRGPAAGARATGGRRRPLDLWAARDAYVDVVLGLQTPAGLLGASPGRRRSACRPGASSRCSWRRSAGAWRCSPATAGTGTSPSRPETRQVLRCAARAARLIDGIAGTRLEAPPRRRPRHCSCRRPAGSTARPSTGRRSPRWDSAPDRRPQPGHDRDGHLPGGPGLGALRRTWDDGGDAGRPGVGRRPADMGRRGRCRRPRRRCRLTRPRSARAAGGAPRAWSMPWRSRRAGHRHRQAWSGTRST